MTSNEQPAGPEMLTGRYILTDIVRRGAQATVTKAFDRKTSRLVAVKRVRFGPDDQRAREAFQREARMLQSLAHDNILELIEVDRDPDGNWFLVLEWIPDNLDDIIAREGAMPWLMFWARFGRPLLDAVAYAQKKRIAHRDIKPKNLLVTESGVVKLADYGIAKLLDGGGGLEARFRGYVSVRPHPRLYALEA
jgi:serine/threonine protein kinase